MLIYETIVDVNFLHFDAITVIPAGSTESLRIWLTKKSVELWCNQNILTTNSQGHGPSRRPRSSKPPKTRQAITQHNFSPTSAGRTLQIYANAKHNILQLMKSMELSRPRWRQRPRQPESLHNLLYGATVMQQVRLLTREGHTIRRGTY